MKDLDRISEFEFFLLNKCKCYSFIGAKRTTLDGVCSGVRKSDKSFVKGAFKQLEKKKILIIHSKKGGSPYFSVDPRMYSKLEELLEKNRCPECFEYLENLEFCKNCNKKTTLDFTR